MMAASTLIKRVVDLYLGSSPASDQAAFPEALILQLSCEERSPKRSFQD